MEDPKVDQTEDRMEDPKVDQTEGLKEYPKVDETEDRMEDPKVDQTEDRMEGQRRMDRQEGRMEGRTRRWAMEGQKVDRQGGRMEGQKVDQMEGQKVLPEWLGVLEGRGGGVEATTFVGWDSAREGVEEWLTSATGSGSGSLACTCAACSSRSPDDAADEGVGSEFCFSQGGIRGASSSSESLSTSFEGSPIEILVEPPSAFSPK